LKDKIIYILKKQWPTLLILMAIVFLQGPAIRENFKSEGKQIKMAPVTDILNGQTYFYPAPSKSIIIFWASWCTPCKFEMGRFKSAIEKGELKAEQIFAINPFEDVLTIKKFLKKESYPFTFIDDKGRIAHLLNISGTPTIAHLDGAKVDYITTGISPLGVWRAIYFLRNVVE
jgi:thiol-disulfide isomerase/thioredoxin